MKTLAPLFVPLAQAYGIDLIQPGPSGLIEELTVMVRPLSAVTALGDAVLAGLIEDGLVPAAGGGDR